MPPAAKSSAVALQTRRLLVSGKVQGVFYRKHTQRQAAALGLGGWVRNLPDGRVEIEAQGPPAQLDALRAWCAQGPPKARVTAVQLVWCRPPLQGEQEKQEEKEVEATEATDEAEPTTVYKDFSILK